MQSGFWWVLLASAVVLSVPVVGDLPFPHEVHAAGEQHSSRIIPHFKAHVSSEDQPQIHMESLSGKGEEKKVLWQDEPREVSSSSPKSKQPQFSWQNLKPELLKTWPSFSSRREAIPSETSQQAIASEDQPQIHMESLSGKGKEQKVLWQDEPGKASSSSPKFKQPQVSWQNLKPELLKTLPNFSSRREAILRETSQQAMASEDQPQIHMESLSGKGKEKQVLWQDEPEPELLKTLPNVSIRRETIPSETSKHATSEQEMASADQPQIHMESLSGKGTEQKVLLQDEPGEASSSSPKSKQPQASGQNLEPELLKTLPNFSIRHETIPPETSQQVTSDQTMASEDQPQIHMESLSGKGKEHKVLWQDEPGEASTSSTKFKQPQVSWPNLKPELLKTLPNFSRRREAIRRETSKHATSEQEMASEDQPQIRMESLSGKGKEKTVLWQDEPGKASSSSPKSKHSQASGQNLKPELLKTLPNFSIRHETIPSETSQQTTSEQEMVKEPQIEPRNQDSFVDDLDMNLQRICARLPRIRTKPRTSR